MINRNSYDEIIDRLKEVYTHHEGLKFDNSLKQITDIRDSFDIKLMFVGHFSGGKSSLINMLIGKPGFLKETQEPQTAIATELIYDETESAYAFDENGKKEMVDWGKEYSPYQYNHLEYRINSEALKAIDDFTVVDTPGFDAGIEAHTKALTSYIGTGSAYLVVIDQEKGGIDEETLEFIREISNYSSQIAILINKCDKITADVAESIAESARHTLSTYDYNYGVYTISKKDIDIKDKLISIILSFNAQSVFDRIMVKRLRLELLSSKKTLSVIQKKIFLDTFDLDAEITMYSRLEEQLYYTFENKRKEAKEELDDMVQQITDRIRSALIARAGSIVDALLCGNQAAAEAVIVETIRPILVSTMKDISVRQIDGITESLDFTGLVSESDKTDLSDVVLNLANNIKGLIDGSSIETKSINDINKANTVKNIYHMITGVAAIATDILAPWLEIVIILLPDVINLLRGIFSESDSQIAERRFIDNVIPQIINRMYPQIKQNVDTTTEHILDEYEKLLTERVEGIKKNIVDAQNKKKQKIQEFENYKSIISSDIDIIGKLVERLG